MTKQVIDIDKVINLSLERQDPSVGIKDASPHSLRMHCKRGVPESEKSDVKGRALEGERHLIQEKWFWHLSLIIARCLVRLWSCSERQDDSHSVEAGNQK